MDGDGLPCHKKGSSWDFISEGINNAVCLERAFAEIRHFKGWRKPTAPKKTIELSQSVPLYEKGTPTRKLITGISICAKSSIVNRKG